MVNASILQKIGSPRLIAQRMKIAQRKSKTVLVNYLNNNSDFGDYQIGTSRSDRSALSLTAVERTAVHPDWVESLLNERVFNANPIRRIQEIWLPDPGS